MLIYIISFLSYGLSPGFCTPGIIVAIYALYANNPTVPYIEEHLDGNLCRCTGYRPIWDAARSLCSDAEEDLVKGPCGVPCRECPERNECERECNVADREEEKKIEGSSTVTSRCCSSSLDKVKHYKDAIVNDKIAWLEQPDLMFPHELLDSDSKVSEELAKPLVVVDKSEYHAAGTWVKPRTLKDLLTILKDFGGVGEGCKLVVGNTEVGIGEHCQFVCVIY
jgi:xanthine dehydrogenase/oxidase